jgi:ectoine hydroxylase-related dioxygenase (phytanoyl-CoA dioxygenase family)
LSALLDHPKILAAVTNLIGPDFNYMGSDGNFFSGDTTWHRDGFSPSNSYIKLALYLDPITSATGCLRVIPGSHTDCSLNNLDELILRDSDNVWGKPQRDLPATPIESEPGDVLLFNHRLLHASFGGGNARRMFTLNLGRRAKTEIEIADLIAYGVNQFYGNGLLTPYGEVMTSTAPPGRRHHLEQLPSYWESIVERHKAGTAG